MCVLETLLPEACIPQIQTRWLCSAAHVPSAAQVFPALGMVLSLQPDIVGRVCSGAAVLGSGNIEGVLVVWDRLPSCVILRDACSHKDFLPGLSPDSRQ